MIRNLLNFAGIAVLVAVASAASAQPEMYYAAHHNYKVVSVADGLVQPWSMAWLPNGDMLVTEKPGRLRILRDGKLLADAVTGTPDVFYQGQGGLFEVLPHPDFENNRWLYLTYAKPVGDGSATAVVRGKLENDRLSNVEEIFVAKSEGRSHYGGKLAFDKEGYLFVSAGDRQVPSRGDLSAHPAQDPSNHHGVIVRLNDDGSVPDDNPKIDKPGSLPDVYSYGHRSPQGLAVHPMTGDLWMTEHGPQGGDELNRIQPGLNYGWPLIGFGVNYASGTPIHETTSRTGYENPSWIWVPSIAASGLMIYDGDVFPQWRGHIFAGGLAGEQLARLHLDENYKEVVLEETLAYGMGRVRDVRQGPDGYIYLAISDRRGQPSSLYRMEPVK